MSFTFQAISSPGISRAGFARWVLAVCLAALALTLAAAAQARLKVAVEQPEKTELGQVTRFKAVVTEGNPPQPVDPATVTFRWTFGNGEEVPFTLGTDEVELTYAAPRHYSVNLTVRDPEVSSRFGGQSFVHTVFRPITPDPPQSSSSIVYDEIRQRVYNVNPDNDTVTIVDAAGLTKLAEIPVFANPQALAIAPSGKLWVVNRDDYAIAIIDLETLAVVDGFRLPYASQPTAIVMSQQAGVAYVSLMALGKVVQIDLATKQVLAEVDAGPWARGLALTHDEATLYVTLWISEGASGVVVPVDTASMQAMENIELAIDPGPDDDQSGRGVPNYLFNATISPDGSEVWVPAKKDNIERGCRQDGNGLNSDNIVRPMVAAIDASTHTELMENRLDLDDRNLPSDVIFSPLGDYAFVILTGSGFVDVRDMYEPARIRKTELKSDAKGPRGGVLTPDGKFFLHSSLTRSHVVFDVSPLVERGDPSPKILAEIPLVETDKLDPQVLRGKQIFYDSEDKRMTDQGYISCASCHFDGFEDGRVWDFSERGEGLRNTTSLLGRRGMGHGNVHWTGNFDEIQDFDLEIRELFGGTGFGHDTSSTGETGAGGATNDAAGTAGTGGANGTAGSDDPMGAPAACSSEALDEDDHPLGEPLSGINEDLDAMAAYVESLDTVNRSPFRNQDGSMTDPGRAGHALFFELGCDFCHSGPDFTDSARGLLHDVGTITSASGERLHEPLNGIDTPTLLGVWETAPYLHDGSVKTLREVLTVKNPGDKHGFVSSLSEQEVDQLVAYLLQIDDGQPPLRLPFEPEESTFVADPPPPWSVSNENRASDSTNQPEANTDTEVSPEAKTRPKPKPKGCAVTVASAPSHPWLVGLYALLAFGLWRRRDRC